MLWEHTEACWHSNRNRRMNQWGLGCCRHLIMSPTATLIHAVGDVRGGARGRRPALVHGPGDRRARQAAQGPPQEVLPEGALLCSRSTALMPQQSVDKHKPDLRTTRSARTACMRGGFVPAKLGIHSAVASGHSTVCGTCAGLTCVVAGAQLCDRVSRRLRHVVFTEA